MDVGIRVKELREAASLTQEQLAEKIDVSVQYISRLERGTVGMSMNTLASMCEVLKVSADYLLFGRRTVTDISLVVNRLQYLTPTQLSIVERSINVTIEALNSNE